MTEVLMTCAASQVWRITVLGNALVQCTEIVCSSMHGLHACTADNTGEGS
jgi:hypothetical protein